VQPLFGWLGDRVDRPWFMSLGIILSGTGISLIGWASSYWMLLACTATTGVGVALFHPEGGKLASVVAGANKATSFSNFSVGGFAGFALGPALVTLALSLGGMKGTVIFIVPAIAMAAFLLTQTKNYRSYSQQRKVAQQDPDSLAGIDDWAGFGKVTTLNFFRSIIGSGISTFLPLFLIASFMITPQLGALTLTCYSAAGATATFLGGRLADRFGLKRTALLGFSLAFPLLIAFVLSPNLILAIACIMCMALCMSASYSAVIVLGQGYLPNRLGLASGISLGIVVSIGGMTSPLLGLVGDQWGLGLTMTILCIVLGLAVLAAISVFFHRDKTGV
jgi:FSR family fosmidomycin resistance protein-like MFS transporter